MQSHTKIALTWPMYRHVQAILARWHIWTRLNGLQHYICLSKLYEHCLIQTFCTIYSIKIHPLNKITYTQINIWQKKYFTYAPNRIFRACIGQIFYTISIMMEFKMFLSLNYVQIFILSSTLGFKIHTLAYHTHAYTLQ